MITKEQAMEYEIGRMGLATWLIYSAMPTRLCIWIFKIRYKRYIKAKHGSFVWHEEKRQAEKKFHEQLKEINEHQYKKYVDLSKENPSVKKSFRIHGWPDD